MDVPYSTSFTPLATLALPHPYLLHPQACNPAMDLVVLIAPGGATASLKGKERAVDVDTRGWTNARVSVWRMLGAKVWDVEVKGRVLGLAWSIDGESVLDLSRGGCGELRFRPIPISGHLPPSPSR